MKPGSTLQGLAQELSDLADRLDEDDGPTDLADLASEALASLRYTFHLVNRAHETFADAKDRDILAPITGEVRARIDAEIDAAYDAIKDAVVSIGPMFDLLNGTVEDIDRLTGYVDTSDGDPPLLPRFVEGLQDAVASSTAHLRQAAAWMDMAVSHKAP